MKKKKKVVRPNWNRIISLSAAGQYIQSQLSEINSEGNTLWRVRIGPYNSVEESNPVRDKLNGMGIKPSVIKSSKS